MMNFQYYDLIRNIFLVCNLFMLYVNIFYTRFINFILKKLKYTRVYDLKLCQDVSIIYYFISYISRNFSFALDISYPVLGVCTFVGDRYVRYICYDTKLTEIIKNTNPSSKNYHSIKKIELIHNGTVQNVTESKHNFYDYDYTNITDVVKFYVLINGYLCDDYDSSTVHVEREYFDDELFEFITIHEEISNDSMINE